MIQEIFGVHEYIQDICRRLAKQGYYAIAPALFSREADVSNMSLDAILKEVVPVVPDAQVMTDIDSTVAFAKASGKVNTARLGIVGYCWGGRKGGNFPVILVIQEIFGVHEYIQDICRRLAKQG
ncbi:dienelactone hydrolase family protein [Mycobacterium tuberculosis]|uniref:dienelactone hydrolase family protein n=1 Tax=Mycobacterium tuberculosis TaxID=1773 RepID=UPI00272C96CD|nr:dienelactone hydrolase family protein [Mycobacterium tuberculosis]